MKEKDNIQKSSLDQLNQIHSMMEQSTRFISLSGLSGIFAGITALAGAVYAYSVINALSPSGLYNGILLKPDVLTFELVQHLLLTAGVILVIALTFGISFTINKANKKGQSIWGKTSQRLLVNMSIPLIAGGSFCLVLFYHGHYGLMAPATLLFYGLALLNASKYTLRDIRYLGILEILLGLISSFCIGYGLLFWAIGFGLLHIIYGVVMYYKYDRV